METTEELQAVLDELGTQQHEINLHEGDQVTCKIYPCSEMRELIGVINGKTFEDASNTIATYFK